MTDACIIVPQDEAPRLDIARLIDAERQLEHAVVADAGVVAAVRGLGLLVGCRVAWLAWLDIVLEASGRPIDDREVEIRNGWAALQEMVRIAPLRHDGLLLLGRRRLSESFGSMGTEVEADIRRALAEGDQ